MCRKGEKNMNKLSIVKIIGGPLEPYLKDIEIVGRVQENIEQLDRRIECVQ